MFPVVSISTKPSAMRAPRTRLTLNCAPEDRPVSDCG